MTMTTVTDVQAWARTQMEGYEGLPSDFDAFGDAVGRQIWNIGHDAGLQSGDNWEEFLDAVNLEQVILENLDDES